MEVTKDKRRCCQRAQEGEKVKVVEQETVWASCFCDRVPGRQPNLYYSILKPTRAALSLNHKNYFVSVTLIRAHVSACEIPNIDIDRL